jgi:hypothetical protein
MGQAFPRQVVLGSQYNHLRALLAVAMIAVVGLTAAVVILAIDDDHDPSADSATQVSAPSRADGTRYDGGPEEGTRGVVPARQLGVRYDGGPEEGSADVAAAQPRLTQEQTLREAARAPEDRRRYDGGPEEGTAALTQRSAPATFDHNSIKQPPDHRYDGGPEEGTRGALSSSPSSNTAPGIRYDGGPEEGHQRPRPLALHSQ